MVSHLNKDKSSSKPIGRPRKRKGTHSINSGRKKIAAVNIRRSAIYSRAQDLADNELYNTDILELAAKLSKRRNDSVNVGNNEENEVRIEDEKKLIKKHTKESGLAFYLEGDYSRSKYQKLINDSKNRNANIYPSYDDICKAAVECEVPLEKATEVEIIAFLQELLDKTTYRLHTSVASGWKGPEIYDYEMHITIGLDGSSGHLNPQQKFVNQANDNKKSDSSLLVSSFVIVMLVDPQPGGFRWCNPIPQSVRFCRPIRICLQNENDEVARHEFNRLLDEANNLKAYRMKVEDGKIITVNYTVTFTMFDGKCVNAITRNAATLRCPMCFKTSTQFGNLKLDFKPIENNLDLGLGLLHCLIKTYEYCLKLSYRKDIEQWSCNGELKDQRKTRKAEVLERLRTELGIRADQVIPRYGTTNTGNVARACFKQYERFSEILEIDTELIKRFVTVLAALRCKNRIDIDKLEEYCLQTYKLNYSLYPWSRLSPTVHKLLMHGCQVARRFPLSLLHYSEDALERSHKDWRKNLIQHARQNSQENRLLDTFQRSMHFSDPLISLIYIDERIKQEKLEEKENDKDSLIRQFFIE